MDACIDPCADEGEESWECQTCDGIGTVMNCCDDICIGQGYCMHGDDDICPACKGSGEAIDTAMATPTGSEEK
jgi:hypothetical protein